MADERERSLRSGSYLWAGAVAAMAGFVAVYVTLRLADNADRRTAAPQPPALTTVVASAQAQPVSGINPLSTGHMAAFVFKKAPEPLPAARFLDASGKELTLADFKNRVVLLNLWATWCAPCRKEMPALDRLQKELGSAAFEVVAVSVDRKGLDGAKAFLDQIKTEKLALYADPAARMGAELRAVGMPTTLLIDRNGREIGRLIGPAEWDSDDAKRLIRAALGG